MSESSLRRSREFLAISDQFKLGALTTEGSHPRTLDLSATAKQDVAAALDLLFSVDEDVLAKYREFVQSGRALSIQQTLLKVLRQGGKLFFTGCGSTGRLSIQLVSIWRHFWQQRRAEGLVCQPTTQEFEDRAHSVMAGGDFALIKAVEGFEDFTAFGKKQIADLGVCSKDAVFAITEGGETSFVIGTAWQGVEAGAKVYFVYNNPDDVLLRQVQRSREVIEDSRIEKINLTTGPMAITGSTRMQATTIQFCVMVSVLEMVCRALLKELDPARYDGLDATAVPLAFLQYLETMLSTLRSDALRISLAKLVCLEQDTYQAGHKNNYFADGFGIDVLTDTTERSPTYCTPPFKKIDDTKAADSWAFLFVGRQETPSAWQHVIKRKPRCVEWNDEEVRALVEPPVVPRTLETIRKISYAELMRFKIGMDGLGHRPLGPGDCAIAIVAESEKDQLLSPTGFHRARLEEAHRKGAATGVIYLGGEESLAAIRHFLAGWIPGCLSVLAPVPRIGFLLDGVTRAGLKMLLNALSTCTMVRLGRVMGNYMIWVVPSNLKLIDRSTRYIQRLTQLDYRAANELLFEVIEYVEPRMKSDQAYPPVVGVSVLRARHNLDNRQAEARLIEEASQ